MIKSNKYRVFYRIAFAVCFVLALISSSFTDAAQGATPDAVPVFPTAAFSQVNSGSSPNRVFTTDLNIFSLDASAKKITIWQKTYLGTQLRQFSGIADVANGAGFKGYTFASPYGLAKHPTQNIIAVADRGVSAQRISFYSYTETANVVLFTYLGSFSGDGVVNPVDVAFFPNGDVAVCGNRYNGLDAYVLKLTGPYSGMTAAGSYLYFASVGSADGLDIDPATGNIFIASASDHCIYEHNGTSFVRTYGVSGTAGSAVGYLNSPTDVSVWRGDSFAPKVVVADQFNNRVIIFNLVSNNQVFKTIGSVGTRAGQFSKPYSVYAADEITVADTVNRRVQLFSMGTTNLDSDSITILGVDTYLESSSATQSLTVLLGSIPSSNVVLNIAGYIPGAIEGPTTLTIPAGANSAVLNFQTLTGPMNCILSFAQSTPVTYSPVSIFFSVLNVAPTITSATATTNTILVGESLELTGVATDPSSTDVLTYTWTFDDGSSVLTGPVVTNTFVMTGIVAVTLTVTDPDGGFDTATFEIEVESGVVPTIVFTDIDTESVTFKIPTAAKDNSFIVKIAPVLSSDNLDWDDWLRISSGNLVIGGTFNETMLMGPLSDVTVISDDNGDGFTYIRVDITWLYENYDTLFFRIMLDQTGP